MTRSEKLRVANVTKAFQTKGPPVIVLDDINFTIEENQFIALVGASGCGKSTLLSLIAGLQDYDFGSISIDSEEILGAGLDRGVVFQAYTLLPWLTAQQNVEFALREAGESGRDIATIALEHLRLVNLESVAGHYPSQLSGGMKQRVAIARALSYRPKMLLMDEPFGALDALTRVAMQRLLTRIWEKHKLTVVFVTHDVEEAVFLADKVFVMSSRPGRIKKVFDVPIERPRSSESMKRPEVMGLQEQILASISEEVPDLEQ